MNYSNRHSGSVIVVQVLRAIKEARGKHPRIQRCLLHKRYRRPAEGFVTVLAQTALQANVFHGDDLTLGGRKVVIPRRQDGLSDGNRDHQLSFALTEIVGP